MCQKPAVVASGNLYSFPGLHMPQLQGGRDQNLPEDTNRLRLVAGQGFLEETMLSTLFTIRACMTSLCLGRHASCLSRYCIVVVP